MESIPITLVATSVFASLIIATLTGCARQQNVGFVDTNWGYARSYDAVQKQLEGPASRQLELPLTRRSKNAGVTILDYASASLAAGDVETAQKALYEAILLTNDMTLGQAEGNASLLFDESTKLWQGEAYERAMIELLHAIALMQEGDFDNARVACDRAIMTDRFSCGGLLGVDGRCDEHGRFQPNPECMRRGYNVLQGDFLAAYVLRTLCYLQQHRMKRAEASWQEAQNGFEVVCSAWDRIMASPAQARKTWTGADGRYAYPNVFVPPFRDPRRAREHLFSLTLDDLAEANLVVVAATGSRPKKVKVGTVGAASRTVNYVHDGYCPPNETIVAADIFIDGNYRGPAVQCLNLFGQAAGRGPSIKDLAQERKAAMEEFGKVLHKYGTYGVQYVGMLIEVLNQEEADIRQWQLLPNAIHLWIGHVEPGSHNAACAFSGMDVPTRDRKVDRALASQLKFLEQSYLAAYDQSLQNPSQWAWPVASRHTAVGTIEVPPSGLKTVFVAEQFNACVSPVQTGPPRTYELLPRRTPPESGS